MNARTTGTRPTGTKAAGAKAAGTEVAAAERRYSVGELARMSGVSVRTLHHYDAVGLVVPTERTTAGYREYGPADVRRLGHVLAYRECGLSLPAIAELLAAEGAERATHLERQLALLQERIERLAIQREVLQRAWEASQMGINLDPEEIVEVFGEHDPLQYADEAKERWGHTDAYAQSLRRTSSYTNEDWVREREETEAVEAEFASCLDRGEPADGPRAKAVAERHREHIDTWFYSCTHETQMALADMYLADPRFTAHYDDRRPGLAAYVHAAIMANALDRIA